MAEKIVIIADPGIDGAFAIALALFDPNLEVLGIGATAGNISAQQATKNIHILVDQLDPPRWPRLGAAPEISYDINGVPLHGPTGLGNTDYPAAVLHNILGSEKLVADIVKQNPNEVTVVCLGPLTVIARAFDIYPDLAGQIKRLVCLGGTVHEPGNAGPVSEFHFACDPASARQVLHSGAPVILIPLDCTRKVLFSPKDLLDLPSESSKASKFLRQIVPYGIAATANMYGIEGFHLKDVLGVAAVSLPGIIETKQVAVDVEVRGELTRGMTVIDQRPWAQTPPNVELAVHVDGQGVRDYINGVLRFRE
jgi:inosine-uridine nucleoside N-ribohydrolase